MVLSSYRIHRIYLAETMANCPEKKYDELEDSSNELQYDLSCLVSKQNQMKSLIIRNMVKEESEEKRKNLSTIYANINSNIPLRMRSNT